MNFKPGDKVKIVKEWVPNDNIPPLMPEFVGEEAVVENIMAAEDHMGESLTLRWEGSDDHLFAPWKGCDLAGWG